MNMIGRYTAFRDCNNRLVYADQKFGKKVESRHGGYIYTPSGCVHYFYDNPEVRGYQVFPTTEDEAKKVLQNPDEYKIQKALSFSQYLRARPRQAALRPYKGAKKAVSAVKRRFL